MFAIKKDIEDLIEIAKLNNANINSLLEVSFDRGVRAGKKARIVEIIKYLEKLSRISE